MQTIPAPPSALSAMLGRPARTLRAGSAEQAGLLAASIARISSDVGAGLLAHGGEAHPLFPSAVALVAHNGWIVSRSAHGHAVRYADSHTMLPTDQRVAAEPRTMYDLASLSKLFTSIAAMQLVDGGRLELAAPVVRYLPAFASHDKGDITISNLLTHTSGLRPDPAPALWQLAGDQRIGSILDTTPQAAPNAAYIYSDLNMLTLQLVLHAVTGKPLDALVRNGITRPLRMTSTMYNPPVRYLPRIAATEYETTPERGMVHGVVHDENAWALGGVAGHAGVFSTADDLAVLAQTMLNGGTYGAVRILTERAVTAMLTNLNGGYPGDDHGLGFELYQHWYMGALATPYTAGHTGFTGTAIVIDPTTGSFSILLTNAVHPSRSRGSTNPVRRAVADDLARAIPVRAADGSTAWYSGMDDASTATMTVAVPLAAAAQVTFALWYDTEPDADPVHLEQSRDGGSTWTPVPFALHGPDGSHPTDGSVSGFARRRWWRASATLSASPGAAQLRWRYETNALYHGRGVYLDALRIDVGDATLFSTARPADRARVQLVGFAPSAD